MLKYLTMLGVAFALTAFAHPPNEPDQNDSDSTYAALIDAAPDLEVAVQTAPASVTQTDTSIDAPRDFTGPDGQLVTLLDGQVAEVEQRPQLDQPTACDGVDRTAYSVELSTTYLTCERFTLRC